MGGRAGGGASGWGHGRMSSKVLYGAAARNELHGMDANDFFHHGINGSEYQKYVAKENADRGFPVVFGNKGAEVGHMVHASETIDGRTYSNTGRIKSFEGDKVQIITKGGYPQWYSKSAIKSYAKDKSMDYGRFIMKVKNRKPISISWGNK